MMIYLLKMMNFNSYVQIIPGYMGMGQYLYIHF